MKIAEINTVDYGSTGRIMLLIAETARGSGDEVWTFSVAPRHPKQKNEGHEYYASYAGYALHYVLGKATGLNGLFSVGATARLIRRLRRIQPDIVHLHNLHGFSINLPMLFRYLKQSGVQVVWTLHDCWSFTGHCAHYLSVKCDRWKRGCHDCPIYKGYPESNVDNSKWMWKVKKSWFTGVEKLVLVTPSNWLASQVRESFLGEYPIRVLNNGIDLELFGPDESDQGLRERHHIAKDKTIILGVAFGWGYKKGLDVFLKLARALGDGYQVVLVGTTEKTDCELPPEIVSIHRTNDQRELAELYSAADVFVNPTREETFPTVNIEALACGTPVVTFDTGGSPEILDEKSGLVVPCDDVTAMEAAIRRVAEEKPFTEEDCRRRAGQFDRREKFSEYVQLYHALCDGKGCKA